MSMPATRPPIETIEALLALPDDGLRHELLDGGHVVTPAPRLLHQRAVTKLMAHFYEALRGRADAETFTSPADVVLGPRTLVQPDLFVVRRAPGRPLTQWADVGVPVVAIEIISETTAARDRGLKRRLYQRAGVVEYWIVDLESRLVERWRPEDTRPEIAAGLLQWSLLGGQSHTLDLPEFFRQVFED